MDAKICSSAVIGSLLIIFAIIAIGCNTEENKPVNRNSYPHRNPDRLLLLSRELLYTNPDSSYHLARSAEAVAKEQKKPLALANAYKIQGSYFSDIRMDYEAAVKCYEQADSIYRQHHGEEFTSGRGAVCHNLGTIELRRGNYLSAIEHFFKALNYFEAANDEKTLPKTLNNLSTLHSFLKDDAMAEQYARECYALARKNRDDYLISVSSTTLAASLINQGKYDEAPQLLDGARSIALKRKDYYILDLIHMNYGGYYQFYKKDYGTAIDHIRQAYLYADSLQNEYEQMRASINLSEAYFSNNQMVESVYEAQRSLSWARMFQTRDIEQRALFIIAKIEERKGNYIEAYEKLHLSYQLRDSVLNESNRQHLNYLEASFRTEKKEIEINSLQKERRLYLVSGLAVIVTLMALLLSLYLRHKNTMAKKQLAEQKVVQLEQEKRLVATQAVLEGETAERARLARDLHDGLGGMLSAVKLNLFDITKDVILEAGDVSRFNKVIEMLDTSMKELRRVAHNMMPESLSRYGLKVALSDFCGSIYKVKFYYFGNESRLDKKLEIMIYRTVHELVNNALKHAEATEINVQLIQEPDRVSVTVQDNGKGFNPAVRNKGMGLSGIENRVTSFHGIMNISSHKNKGTEINVEFTI